MQKIKAILVDDHQIFRECLQKVLSESEKIEIIASASNGKEFLSLLKHYKTDIVLMDISMPEMDGIEATQQAVKLYPDLKIIALSMYNDQEYYYKMVHAGVKGFVLKKSTMKELEKAIVDVVNGDSFFSNELLRNIIVQFNQKATNHEENISLTKRELEILHLICKGFSNAEIAEQLNLSTKTIDTHKYNLLSKTQSKNSVSLVMYAIKNRLIEL